MDSDFQEGILIPINPSSLLIGIINRWRPRWGYSLCYGLYYVKMHGPRQAYASRAVSVFKPLGLSCHWQWLVHSQPGRSTLGSQSQSAWKEKTESLHLLLDSSIPCACVSPRSRESCTVGRKRKMVPQWGSEEIAAIPTSSSDSKTVFTYIWYG